MRNLPFPLFLLSFSFFSSQILVKDKPYYLSAIGFWNVENLYDTVNDKWKNDDDFTPEGLYTWDGKKYWKKIARLSEVISEMATEVCPDGLALLGMCEIENKSVLNDLVSSALLKSRNYQVVHMEGPDARGIDPALIYNPKYFKVKSVLAYPVKLVNDSNHKTRDILVLSGLFLNEPMAVLVNHWPSRRGGELLSRINRNAAALIARKIADSICTANTGTKVIIMGDMNDDPVNESVKRCIGTYADIKESRPDAYYNPMEKMYRRGIGTLAYQDSWNLFDQILLNQAWMPTDYNQWQYYAVRIHNKNNLKTPSGNYKAYPFRTFSAGVYTGGYSDHFASYIIIAKEKN